MSGETVNKFLIIFRLLFFENQYIFAVTSFAPDDVCARMSARIRVFQTLSARSLGIERDLASTTPELRRAVAIANYDKTRLMPRIDWLGNVFPAHLAIPFDTKLNLQSGCLVLPASVIHRLGDQNPGVRLCEVLVDLEFSKKDLNQQDTCVIDDRSEVFLPANLLEVPRCPLIRGVTPLHDQRALLQDEGSNPQTRDSSDAIIQESTEFMFMGKAFNMS
jgi:hypothetical protein